MITKSALTEADVTTLIAGAKTEAQKNSWAVSIAVMDDGGHLLGFLRLDGAAVFSASVAVEKAKTAALGCRESKNFEDMINNGRYAFLSVPTMQGLLEGGVPVIHGGRVVGAIGVSGVKSNEDAQIAKAGVAALLT